MSEVGWLLGTAKAKIPEGCDHTLPPIPPHLD